MCHRFNRCASATWTIVLLAGACSDITEPPAGRPGSDPSFSHGGASETRCVTGMGQGTIPLTGTHDNVTVPPEEACVIVGATILGNVKALENSSVIIIRSTVGGNIEGDRPDVLQVNDGSTVGNIFVTGAGVEQPEEGLATVAVSGGVTVTGGNVHILKANANGILIQGVTVQKGSIKVEENTVAFLLEILSNRVAQNLQVIKNQGGSRKEVTRNFVGANLQCFDNDEPFDGDGNFARNAEGQCSAAPLPPDFPIPIP
jgi:hypothetical protein